VQRAVKVTATCGTRVVLKVAQTRELPESLPQVPDPLVLDEHEASFMLQRLVGGVESGLEAASTLLSLGPQSAVLTLRAAGAVVATEEGTEHYSMPKVSVVDTIGAGDALVGALVARLTDDSQVGSVAAFAVRAATDIVK
jgi:ribokinase